MKRATRYLAAILLVALVVGVILFVSLRTGTAKKTTTTVPGGKKVEVTPTDKLRVETAEGQPSIDLSTYRLSVEGLVDNKLSLSFDEIKALPAQERFVKLPCVEGWTDAATWKGPRLADLLERAGVQKKARTVVFDSPGGYSTSLTLDDVKATDPLLAYDVNGARLPDEQGYPLRLVVPNKLGYKWIKWVVAIKLIEGDYKGYWESRGYSNSADATGR
jgi:DMSO/TMAO reductase YedYZ molybdopterin-dependent catalytic subunit